MTLRSRWDLFLICQADQACFTRVVEEDRLFERLCAGSGRLDYGTDARSAVLAELVACDGPADEVVFARVSRILMSMEGR